VAAAAAAGRICSSALSAAACSQSVQHSPRGRSGPAACSHETVHTPPGVRRRTYDVLSPSPWRMRHRVVDERLAHGHGLPVVYAARGR